MSFFGACLIEPRVGIITEYCEKGSLESVLKKESLSWKTKLQILLGIAKGMSFLHAKGILHRDLKTANVLVCNVHHFFFVHTCKD